MKKKSRKYLGIYQEADRYTRVKMYKSGKQWVSALLSQISLLRFLGKKNVEQVQISLDEERREASFDHKDLLKGLTALGALTGGAYMTQQTAFADVTPGSAMTSTATTSTLATTDKVNLTSGSTESLISTSQVSNSQSKDEASLSKSYSESSSISASASKSENLSTSTSKSESISQSQSASKSHTSTSSKVDSNNSGTATSEQSLTETANSETSLTDATTATNKLTVNDLGTTVSGTNLLGLLNESKITTTATNSNLLRNNLMLFAASDADTTSQLISNAKLNIYVGSTIYPQDQGTLAISGSMHINDGAQTGDTFIVQLSNNMNLNGISADGTRKALSLVDSDGSVVATSSYDASTN